MTKVPPAAQPTARTAALAPAAPRHHLQPFMITDDPVRYAQKSSAIMEIVDRRKRAGT